jgi:DNA repair protein RecO (recombination protein O)
MITQTALQPAYVLHTRPYRETSALVELLTVDEGRLSAVAKGLRRRHSPLQGLQPFIPLLVSYVGNRCNLVILQQSEISNPIFGPPLKGRALLAGFYLNEILIRLLPRADPSPELFNIYQQTLQGLRYDQANMEPLLRCFEKNLLKQLGYGLELARQLQTGTPVDPDRYYSFDLENGLAAVSEHNPDAYLFKGSSVLALHHEIWENDLIALQDAKRLMRRALAPLLGDKPLKSRELFV